MASAIPVDAVSFFAQSAGTGTYVYSTSRSSFYTPAQAVTAGSLVDGQLVPYVAQDDPYAPTQREWGIGTYTNSTLSIARTTIQGGISAGVVSGAGTPVNFSKAPVVFIGPITTNIITGTVVPGTSSTAYGGTAASSTLTLQSTSGTGTSDAIIFKTGNNVEQARFDTTGNFIMTGSQNIAGGTGAASALSLESTTGAGTSDMISFKVASQTEWARINNSGALLLNPNGNANSSLLQVYGQVASIAEFYFDHRTNDANGAIWQVVKYRASGFSTGSALSAGDLILQIWGSGYDSVAQRQTALINLNADANFGSSSAPGRISFWTTASSAIFSTERVRVDSAGLTSFTNGSFGYGLAGNGDGGTVTQITSRTTGVTLNTVCGQITLVSAAGSTTAASFTVTNSKVGANDVIILNQKSGTDKYDLSVTAVAAGSFQITSRTYAGTTTEQPVFTFAVIKAVAT